jgi:hypothetical protein
MEGFVEMEQKRSQRTWMPTLAGVLDICAGGSGLIGSVPVAMIGIGVEGLVIPTDTPIGAIPLSFIGVFFVGLSLLLFAAGVIGIIGGVHAILRKSRLWVLAGAIAAVFAFFPFGVLSVILTVLSEGEIGD